jgi:Peptidase family M28
VRLFAAALIAATALYGAIAFDRISADSLRTNVTWLAADQRQGRMTPSPGLEASADYLAAQFQQAGLAPGGQDGAYFQTADFAQITPQLNDFQLTIESRTRHASVGSRAVTVHSLAGIDYQQEPILRLRDSVSDIAGRVVAGNEGYASPASLHLLETRKPALILLFMEGDRPQVEVPFLMEADPSLPPVMRIYNRAVASLLNREDGKLTLHIATPLRHDVLLRNVAGILRGSDPAVRDQFVILSAHYDHLGMKQPGPGNRIFHGANDNASGDASLIEIAKALSAELHPRRSVLFLALFGEEEGLLGSGYYVRHPLIPLVQTVADINLEQLGRTDSSDGPELARFGFTGPSYSNLPQTMAAAAKVEGATVYRKETANDYFDRSDNYSFALAGVVAHTIAVAFEFPDYHAVSDEAEKIDYANLVRVDRGIAAGVAAVANATEAPKWSGTRFNRR